MVSGIVFVFVFVLEPDFFLVVSSAGKRAMGKMDKALFFLKKKRGEEEEEESEACSK